MKAGLITAQEPAWAEALSVASHDIYHLPAYVEFATRWQEPGTPAAFVAREDGRVFFLPLIVRQIPDAIDGAEHWLDASGPRGYPGPILGPAADGSCDPEFTQRAVARLSTALAERGIVSAFVRCHPLLSPPVEAFGRAGTFVEHGQSVSIDLLRSADEVWAETRPNHRRAITRALRDGYRVRIDESWQYLDEFAALYDATMDRLGAAAHWRLPRDYFADLHSTIGTQAHLCVVELDGALAAAALLTEVDGIVEYHLSGTSPDHVVASPTKLLINQASKWARERRNRVLHLAGSLRRDDSLIHFKRGFSPKQHPVYSWRIVTDPAKYSRLVARRDRLDGASDTQGSHAIGDYFPAYRRPIVSVVEEHAPEHSPHVR